MHYNFPVYYVYLFLTFFLKSFSLLKITCWLAQRKKSLFGWFLKTMEMHSKLRQNGFCFFFLFFLKNCCVHCPARSSETSNESHHKPYIKMYTSKPLHSASAETWKQHISRHNRQETEARKFTVKHYLMYWTHGLLWVLISRNQGERTFLRQSGKWLSGIKVMSENVCIFKVHVESSESNLS